MAYEIELARTISIGVISVNQPKDTLKEAKNILEQERYRDVYLSKLLLEFIKRIDNNQK